MYSTYVQCLVALLLHARMCSGLAQWVHGCVKDNCMYVLPQYCHGVVQYRHTMLQYGCQLHTSQKTGVGPALSHEGTSVTQYQYSMSNKSGMPG